MVRRYSEHRALNMFSLRLDKWEFPLHSHNFFELIYILEGQGKHLINGFVIPYQQHSCFLITPEDEHEFIIETPTCFEYMKFTELLLKERNHQRWQQNISVLLRNSNRNGREIICHEEDRAPVIRIIQLMRKEYDQNRLMGRDILLDLFGALLSLLARNVIHGSSGKKPDQSNTDERIQSILAYLREHLTEKEKTNVQHLAATFNLSPSYVSEFFKKHTGETLQQFLIRSKLSVAERLLKQSNFTISEIADQLAFNDPSHFNKTFTAVYKQSPGLFRKKAL